MARVDVNIAIFADLTIAAGALVILPSIKITGIESSNKVARNLFGYLFLGIVIFVALGDSHKFLTLPNDSKSEFFTIISHIMLLLFGASKFEISRNVIEGVKDSFNWRRSSSSQVSSFNDGYSNYSDEGDEIAQAALNEEVSKLKTANSSRNNILAAMQSYRGMCEIKGPAHNKKLLSLAKKAGFDWYTKDEIPWCAVMMNICCMIAGIPGTKSAMAKSFLKWGRPISLEEARNNIGKVIAVFHRGSSSSHPSGHVTTVERISSDGKTIVALGGNQGNCVRSNKMDITSWRFIGFRVA